MLKMLSKVLFLSLVLVGYSTAAEQALELAAPFTDDMILQRDCPVPVWGFDSPGSKVTVRFADQQKETVTDESGAWRVDLDPLAASKEERGFTVRNAAGAEIALAGVLVGEVWFSSGQSNMVWPAGKSMCGELARTLAGAGGEVPVREISINTVSALYPQRRATSAGGWKRSDEAGGFSALSLSFAYDLHKALDVPVGILLSAHSNTRIEAFTARPAIEAHALLAGDVELMHKGDVLTEVGRAAFAQYEKDLRAWQDEAGPIAEAGGRIPARPNLPGIAGMWRGPSQFFNGKINPVVPYAIRGAIWCQGTNNGSDSKIYAARMEALVRGWREAWGMPEMPFYFTQQQCYGAPDPDNAGFADLRQAQHLFFINNRDHVGMVVQTDLNSARPGGIHYWNKLHPGMRLARWALAKDYGKDIAYTGPIFAGAEVRGDAIIVSFEKESLFGGLMVGSKGMAKDYREPGKFVEPARPTPDDALNHFRLCGAGKTWHAAEATIEGDTVVVRAKAVPKPIGVQYAYSAVPERSNLYNKAGLPATPFAVINGELIFAKDDAPKPAVEVAPQAVEPPPVRPTLHIANYLRHGAILQRDMPLPIWGHANAGATVTVELDGVTRTAIANELEQWSVSLPAMKASSRPLTLKVETDLGSSRTVGNILIGDVWYLTGSMQLTSEWPYNTRDADAALPEPMPLVREFRRKTKASTSTTPRKRRFETGGGKYRSSWLTADYSKPDSGVTAFAYAFAKALGRDGVPQGFITMSAGQGGRARQMASPLSWTSLAGLEGVENPAFKARLEELALQYPHTEIAKRAVDQYLEDVRATIARAVAAAKGGERAADELPLAYPAFPQPGRSGTVAADTVPTYAYNWCVSPHTPMAVSGVVWVPSVHNLGEKPAEYAAELEIYARSLPGTYGQKTVPFFYAQPAATLVEGMASPVIPGGKSVGFDRWPKSLKETAEAMAALVD